MGKDAASAGPWEPRGELGLHPEEKRLLNMCRHSMARLAFQRENSGSSLHSSQCSQFPDEETEDLSRAVPCLRSSGWMVSTPGFHPGLLSPQPAKLSLHYLHIPPKLQRLFRMNLHKQAAQLSGQVPELQLPPLVHDRGSTLNPESPCTSSGGDGATSVS